MRSILLAICLLSSTSHFAQNLQDYPALLLDPEVIRNDHFSVEYRFLDNESLQRNTTLNNRTFNEEHRQEAKINYDSVVTRIKNEETSLFDLDKKSIYKYDEEGRKILTQFLEYDQVSETWINKTKRENLYEGGNSSLREISYKWENGNWIETYKTEYTYNQNGDVTSRIYYSYDENSKTLKPNQKVEHIFDDLGKLIEVIDYQWDEEWYVYIIDEFSYGENDLLELMEIFLHSASGIREDFFLIGRDTYEYNDQLKLESYMSYSFNYEKGVLEPERKEETSYDEDGKLNTLTTYKWEGESETWANNSKTDRKYNSSGKLTHYSAYEWSIDLQQWIGSFQSIYFYNESGKQIGAESYYGWDENSNWVANQKATYSYHSTGNILNAYYHNWNLERGDWEVTENQTFYYSHPDMILGNLNFSSTKEVLIYPNPANESFNLSNFPLFNSTVIILDENGKKVRKFDASEMTFDIEDLKPGIYYVLFPMSGQVKVEKLIKR